MWNLLILSDEKWPKKSIFHCFFFKNCPKLYKTARFLCFGNSTGYLSYLVVCNRSANVLFQNMIFYVFDTCMNLARYNSIITSVFIMHNDGKMTKKPLKMAKNQAFVTFISRFQCLLYSACHIWCFSNKNSMYQESKAFKAKFTIFVTSKSALNWL